MKYNALSAGELSVLCMELAEIWHAGLSLEDGLYALCGERGDEAGPELAALYRAALEGAALPDAMRAAGGYPQYAVELLALAERTGAQEDTLRALSDYYDRTDRLRASVRSAVLYPAVLVVVMLAVVAVLLTQVLPVFRGVFEQLGLQMGGLAGVLLRLGEGLSGAAAWIGGAVAALAAAAFAASRFPRAREAAKRAFYRVCGGRGLFVRISSTRFLQAMTMAARSGMDAEEAAGYAASLCPDDPRTRAKIEACVRRLGEGERLGDALGGLLPARSCRMIALAERTGSQAEVFAEIAARSERAVDDTLDRAVGWIEPALVILTAALVGLILLSVMLPLLGIMSTLG